jgi:hypothetical protein
MESLNTYSLINIIANSHRKRTVGKSINKKPGATNSEFSMLGKEKK